MSLLRMSYIFCTPLLAFCTTEQHSLPQGHHNREKGTLHSGRRHASHMRQAQALRQLPERRQHNAR